MKIRIFAFKICLLFIIQSFLFNPAFSQNEYNEKKYQFLSFEKIPTWVGLATNWEKAQAEIHLYDFSQYKGHADYISKALKTGINFAQFKNLVKNPLNRKYLPFFLFDLRDCDFTINGKKYEWAVRIEDYRYEDDQKQMETTVLRLLHTVSQYINQQSKKKLNGFIILATYSEARPNTSTAKFINQEGFPNMTLSQLISKAGGKKVEVLNQGTAVGYLKYVTSGQETSFKTSYKDILVYEKLPQRVATVAGIITLEPQTPLSHINLLAKNRGTPNLYTIEIENIPGAKSLFNKLVKMECFEKKISIAEISRQEAEKYWTAHAVKVEIPTPELKINKIIDLNKPDPVTQNTSCIGAKAANYSIIMQLLPNYVKPGFAIPFGYYFNTIKSCGVDTLIESLVKSKADVDERNKQLEKIRKTILSASIDLNLLKDINQLVSKRFNNMPIRLRSSTNCEDLPQFNGAGLYLSKGYKICDGDKKLNKKILQVYASLWTPLAFEEREYYQIDHLKTGMAILINESFPNEYANGVGLTIPEKNNISVYINSQFGENAVTNPENGQIPEAIIFENAQDDNYKIQSKSNIHDVFIQNNLKTLLIELKKAILDIHHTFTYNLKKNKNTNYGVDIEFKIEKEKEGFKLYIKQARLLRSILPE